MFHYRLDYFQEPSLGDRLNTKLESMVVQNLTMADLLYLIMCEQHAWIEIP